MFIEGSHVIICIYFSKVIFIVNCVDPDEMPRHAHFIWVFCLPKYAKRSLTHLGQASFLWT